MWAEPLKDSILRVVAVNLSNMLDTNRVFRFPQRNASIPLAFRVGIDIVRFDGLAQGDVEFTARWTLFRKKDIPLLTKVTITNVPVAEPGYDGLIAAQNRALQLLSMEIARAIKDNGEKK